MLEQKNIELATREVLIVGAVDHIWLSRGTALLCPYLAAAVLFNRELQGRNPLLGKLYRETRQTC